MFQLNDKQYRNLEEQVLKNKEDIARHYEITRVLNDFGIRVIGRLNTKEELDAVPTDTLDYGDAYAIGAEPPYTFYIWTRANDDSDVDYWFNMGELAIAGPQGPEGAYITQITIAPGTFYPTFTFSNGNSITVPQSIRGPRGATGRTGERGPQGVQGRTGERGEQGPRGQVGPQGPAGTFNIKGTLSSTDLLPDATTMKPGDAYLVLAGTALYDLYILVAPISDDIDTYFWQNTGLLGAGTTITVNGSAVSSWNADTKLDKNTSTSAYDRVYCVTANGEQSLQELDQAWYRYGETTIPIRDKGGELHTPTPTTDTSCATKKYVDDAIAAIPTGGGSSGSGSTTIDVTADAPYSEKEYLLLDGETAISALDSCSQNHKPAILTIIFASSTSASGDFHDCTSMVINLPPHDYNAVHSSYSQNDFAAIDPTGQVMTMEYYADYKGYEVSWRGATPTSWWYEAIAGLATNKTKVYLTY